MPTPVYLEVGGKKIFACALDWPGWSRAATSEDAALEALAAHAERYRPVAEAAGAPFPATAGDDFEVVERLKGDATTDFGAPGAVPAADSEPLTAAQADRLASLVEGAWTLLERVASSAPAELRKGPRGGGRDRDKMVAHVVDAETSYFHKVGVKTREAFVEGLRAARAPQLELPTKTWPWRYAARRVAWHALDHAWEMEDRST